MSTEFGHISTMDGKVFKVDDDVTRLQAENARLKERLKWIVKCVRGGSKDEELSTEVRLIADGHRDDRYIDNELEIE